MPRNLKIGITRDLFDANGVFITPGPGLDLLDEMPGVVWKMLNRPRLPYCHQPTNRQGTYMQLS
jgi:hypothetical protein